MAKGTKNKNWSEKCFKRFMWLFSDNPNKEFGNVNTYFKDKKKVNSLSIQFQYFLSSEKAKELMKKEFKKFTPIQIGKIERKFVRAGRLA